MERSNEVNSTTKQAKTARSLAWLFSGLFVIALVGVIYLLTNNNRLQDDQAMMQTQIEGLDEQRTNLETELATIETNFTDKIAENEELATTLQTRVEEVEALQWKLTDARKKLKMSEKENAEITTRIEMLEGVKKDLQADIAALAATNKDLQTVNEEIRAQLSETQEYAASLNEHLIEMSEANSQLMQRLYTIAPAGYTAQNFVVTSEKRNDKLTSKANRTDEVKVRFDINDVPENYRGQEEIYLVLAKFDGQPVATVPTKTVRIASREPFDIKAADVEKLSLNERQNIEMSVATDKDLEAGTYNLLVYADHGFLGATAFQLR